MPKVAEWHPIAEFDFGAAYADASFLVWIVPPPGSAFGENFQECWIEDGKFMGTWRHVCAEDGEPIAAVNALEPVAFMLIDAPTFVGGDAVEQAAAA
jgi:hypothetical protein